MTSHLGFSKGLLGAQVRGACVQVSGELVVFSGLGGGSKGQSGAACPLGSCPSFWLSMVADGCGVLWGLRERGLGNRACLRLFPQPMASGSSCEMPSWPALLRSPFLSR